MTIQDRLAEQPARVSRLHDPRFRGAVLQVLVFIALLALAYWFAANTVENLQRSNIASGFDFLKRRAGFDISDALVAYSNDSTYGRALVVGLLNTVLVAALGIVTATVIGFLVGIGRLSRNWLVSRLCLVYVEVFRNIPLLLWIGFQLVMLLTAGEDGVSYAAHVGGLAAGALLVLVLRRPGVPLFDQAMVTPRAVEIRRPPPAPAPPRWGRS